MAYREGEPCTFSAIIGRTEACMEALAVMHAAFMTVRELVEAGHRRFFDSVDHECGCRWSRTESPIARILRLIRR
jgi:hypothetical protein